MTRPQGNTSRLTKQAAMAWIDRWDAQQQVFMSDREERFSALIEAAQAAIGRPDPLVIDLGCGPGSLAIRLLDRLPAARVVAVDMDPVLLALGSTAEADRPGLRFADADLRVPGWSAVLGLDGPADAAISTTALHWLKETELVAMYAELAAVLRPGGLLLNGDHLLEDEATAPVLAQLGLALRDRAEERCLPDGHAESWAGWWDAVMADPALSESATERERRHYTPDHHDGSSKLLAVHVAALRRAGFAEIGTLWQRGDNRLLCGVLAS